METFSPRGIVLEIIRMIDERIKQLDEGVLTNEIIELENIKIDIIEKFMEE